MRAIPNLRRPLLLRAMPMQDGHLSDTESECLLKFPLPPLLLVVGDGSGKAEASLAAPCPAHLPPLAGSTAWLVLTLGRSILIS